MVNRYAYTMGDPVNLIDPDGNSPRKDAYYARGQHPPSTGKQVQYLNLDLIVAPFLGGDVSVGVAFEMNNDIMTGFQIYGAGTKTDFENGAEPQDNPETATKGLQVGVGINMGAVSGTFQDFNSEAVNTQVDVGALSVGTTTQNNPDSVIDSAIPDGSPGTGFEIGIGAGVGGSQGVTETKPILKVEW